MDEEGFLKLTNHKEHPTNTAYKVFFFYQEVQSDYFEKELKKIPFFVRGKARKNTEAYANSRGISKITVETLYEAKAYYAS